MKIFSWTERCYCRRGSKGGVLILVLWALFFLSALGLAINAYIRPQLSLAYRLKNKVQADYLAQAMLKQGMAHVLGTFTEEDTASALKDTWSQGDALFKNIDLGEGHGSILNTPASSDANDLKYGFMDEERKLNINKTSLEVLQRFFEIAGGLTSQQAGNLAHSMVYWRGGFPASDGSCVDQSYYQSLNPPYACKMRNFEILQELLLVKGMTAAIFDKVKNYLTIYSGGQVNINTASSFVLQGLGLSELVASKIVQFRNGLDGQPATSDDNVLLTVNNMVNEIRQTQDLTQEEVAQLTNMVAASVFCTRSDYFSATAQGAPYNSKESTQISFVFNREKVILFWKEQ